MKPRVPLTLALGGALTMLLLAMAIFAPWVAPSSPFDQNLYAGLDGPATGHALGNDRLGRDMLSRIIFGFRVSFSVGFTVVIVSSLTGTAIGAIAGYAGGKVDEALMRVCDVFMAFPGILLAIAFMAATGPGLGNVVAALCLMGWTSYARLARGQALSLREREFVTAAEALGAGPGRIVFLHILPNMLAPLIVEGTFGLASAMVAEAGLSFLGLGVQPPNPSLGSMLAEGRQFILVAPHMVAFPGLAIMAAVMGVNFMGDGLRDWLDPKNNGR
ncbi:MAG: ABC transporter permease [Nitrospinae bacterium]|nr:ABC transporter permease [Nitrospinota bacterium]